MRGQQNIKICKSMLPSALQSSS